MQNERLSSQPRKLGPAKGGDLAASEEAVVQEISSLKKALQLQRRQTTLLNAELHQMRETLEILEPRLERTTSALESCRARRKEMVRVIRKRDAAIVELDGEVRRRLRQITELEGRLALSNPVRRIGDAVRRASGKIRQSLHGRAAG
jgi:predicted RNase H-like nuclease (RuvC/YqgF family)